MTDSWESLAVRTAIQAGILWIGANALFHHERWLYAAICIASLLPAVRDALRLLRRRRDGDAT